MFSLDADVDVDVDADADEVVFRFQSVTVIR